MRSWIQCGSHHSIGIHHLAVDEHREVQVIAARHAGLAALAELLALVDHRADRDFERREVPVERLHAHAVVDDDAVPVDAEVGGVEHLAAIGRHGRASSRTTPDRNRGGFGDQLPCPGSDTCAGRQRPTRPSCWRTCRRPRRPRACRGSCARRTTRSSQRSYAVGHRSARGIDRERSAGFLVGRPGFDRRHDAVEKRVRPARSCFASGPSETLCGRALPAPCCRPRRARTDECSWTTARPRAARRRPPAGSGR